VKHLPGVPLCFIHKHWTRLERLVRDNHCNLFGPFLIYKEKSFIRLALGGSSFGINQVYMAIVVSIDV
jgi:hypothetical protein